MPSAFSLSDSGMAAVPVDILSVSGIRAVVSKGIFLSASDDSFGTQAVAPFRLVIDKAEVAVVVFIWDVEARAKVSARVSTCDSVERDGVSALSII